MQRLHPVYASIAISLLLLGCTHPHSPTQMASNFINRQSVVPTTNETYPAKSPQHVAVYNNASAPLMPYRVIGVASISKFNLLGVERKEATMHTMLKQLAASAGGDGIINLNSDKNTMQAHIIAYQHILI